MFLAPPQPIGRASLELPELPRYSIALFYRNTAVLRKQPKNQLTSCCLHWTESKLFWLHLQTCHEIKKLCVSRHLLYNDQAKHTCHCYVHLLHIFTFRSVCFFHYEAVLFSQLQSSPSYKYIGFWGKYQFLHLITIT